jgi:hemoglobin-like flavoprotein
MHLLMHVFMDSLNPLLSKLRGKHSQCETLPELFTIVLTMLLVVTRNLQDSLALWGARKHLPCDEEGGNL